MLENLRTSITNSKLFVEIQPLGLDLSCEIIRDWLADSSRTLTDAQFETVKTALSKCSLPLYTRLVFDRICTWHSFSPPSQTTLEFQVKSKLTLCAPLTVFIMFRSLHWPTRCCITRASSSYCP